MASGAYISSSVPSTSTSSPSLAVEVVGDQSGGFVQGRFVGGQKPCRPVSLTSHGHARLSDPRGQVGADSPAAW